MDQPTSQVAKTKRSDESSVRATRVFRYSPSAVVTPANILTILRLVASVPFLFWLYYEQSGWMVGSAFIVLAMSDVVDGIIARRNGPTTFGAFFDPLADKVLAIGAFLVYGIRGDYIWIPIIIMAFREIAVSGARSILSRYKISLPARQLGKLKTFLQLSAVGIPMLPPFAQYHSFHLGLLWSACALSVISGIDLFVHAQREVQAKDIHIGDPFPS
jgi:CDP-diacylglycerol--glycerol-3-phosphate 3-phosphatidyltransferase